MEGSRQQIEQLGGTVSTVPSFTVAAHELKSPLSLIRQLALYLESADVSPHDVAQLAQQIALTSERALRLTTDVTKVARLEDGLFTLEPLNPAVVCQEIIDELTPLYAAHGRSLRLVSPRRHALLGLANYDLLRRILANFIDNALHYSEPNTPVAVTASTRDHGRTIRLGVRDFGPALPARTRQQLGRQATVVHSRPGSSGMGVYIARQFAEAMHATVGVINHRDGATFYVDIAASAQLRLL